MTTFTGIDIAKDKFDVILVCEGHDPEPTVFENYHKGLNQCHRFLKKRKPNKAKPVWRPPAFTMKC